MSFISTLDQRNVLNPDSISLPQQPQSAPPPFVCKLSTRYKNQEHKKICEFRAIWRWVGIIIDDRLLLPSEVLPRLGRKGILLNEMCARPVTAYFLRSPLQTPHSVHHGIHDSSAYISSLDWHHPLRMYIPLYSLLAKLILEAVHGLIKWELMGLQF